MFKKICCCLFIILALSGCKEKADDNQQNNNTQKVDMEAVLVLDKHATFGHIGLGLQMSQPEMTQLGVSRTRGFLVYPHGMATVNYGLDNSIDLYVETTLEGASDLNTLPIKITEEKHRVTQVTDEIGRGLQVAKIDQTEKVKIGDYETIYFQMNASEDNAKKNHLYLGYSFMYNNQPYVVGAAFKEHDQYTIQYVQKIVQYVILSLKEYKGEAFAELQENNNYGLYFNKYQSPLSVYFKDAAKFTLYGHGTGTQATSTQFNRGTGSDDLLHPNTSKYTPSLELIDVTYDKILETVLNTESLKKKITSVTDSTFNVIKEESVTIYDIPMMRYEMEILSPSTNKLKHFIVIYTFVYDGVSYLWQCDDDNNIYEMTDLSEIEHEIKLARLYADTMIRTFSKK